MGQQIININGTATQMVNDINSNFGELYQGAGGGSASASVPTKRVRVYDVMTRAFQPSGNIAVGTITIPCTIKKGTEYYIEQSNRGSWWPNTEVTINGSGGATQTLLSTTNGTITTGAYNTAVEATIDGTSFSIYGYVKGYVNIYHYEDVPTIGATRWLGKKWLVIGDSISTEHQTEAGVGYSESVAKSLGMQRENVAVSGTSSLNWIEGFQSEGRDFGWNKFSAKYDLVTVMLGTNDQGYDCPVGTISDTGTGTYYGRLKTLYNNLRGRYPKSVIAFITPIKRYNADGTPYVGTVSGLTTELYAQAVRDVCDYFSIPCIDLYYSIDPSTQTARDNFFIESGNTHDGTHPNDVGHALFLAPIVEARLRDIAPFYFNEWT